ncbi:hypothetical protein BSZ35_02760 [Salinibacter sp. 10B]|uniref:collagen-like protein n=1 Tax=Salinibacter sp. 10B TaxID=1923971 RepID=UPI000CF53712|nr:collagen-like protein [Salinibacter sp. 10B]PQJ33659.1 hypothetical protein BSZ35_02760 [Salinibacter sp. 10B]
MVCLGLSVRALLNSRVVVVLIWGLVGGGLLACEGPAGPQGPQGPEGPQGEQGPPGADGAEPKIINLDLTDHVQNTTFDRGSNTLTSKGDTLSIQWGAAMDTAITSVTIADSMYVKTYVRVPGSGFQPGPIRFAFDGEGNPSNVEREADPFAQVEYDLLEQLPSPSRDSLFAAEAVGGSDRRFYTGTTDQHDIHEVIVEPDRFTARIRAYDAASGSEYKSGIVETFTTPPPVPFDSDLSGASAGTYPTANAAGEVTYRQSTTDLSAIQSVVGEDLRLQQYELQATKEGSFGSVIRTEEWQANPRPGRVEVRSTWTRDSISVAGVIVGTNYGSDRTIYNETIPVEVRIAIVSGSLADKMRRGRTVPFSTLQERTRP